MEPPFDISADLDTPVSTYLKLGPLQPRYLLESVEGGSHLARYSFLGFGSVTENSGSIADGIRDRRANFAGSGPESSTGVARRAARTDAGGGPEAVRPEVPELPFSGGLVGIAGYDLVRYFERLENRPPAGASNGAELRRRRRTSPRNRCSYSIT